MPSSELVDGAYAAALTPMTADMAPDTAAHIAHCQWLLKNGCDGIAPLGTTGEANSIGLDHRSAVIKAIAAAKLPSERVIIGTGNCAVQDTLRLTREAVKHGYPNVLVLPPFYYKSVSDDGLFAFFAKIIETVNDPALRLYLYHFPQMSAVPITQELVGRLRDAYGPVVAGLKDSSGDWSNTKAMMDAFPGFRAFSGTEQYLSDNLKAGGPGCISATTNVTAPLAGKVVNASEAARDALQQELTELRLVLQQFPLVAALKQIMEWHTGENHWQTILPPLTALSPERAEELKQAISGFALFQNELVLGKKAA